MPYPLFANCAVAIIGKASATRQTAMLTRTHEKNVKGRQQKFLRRYVDTLRPETEFEMNGKKQPDSHADVREELFATSDSSTTTRQRPRDVRSQDVTESLLELRGVLQTSVSSSREATQRLVSSSSQIVRTKTGMEEIGADIKGSGRLISKYERRELTDRVLITLGLILFFGVVFYIIQKRLLGWLW